MVSCFFPFWSTLCLFCGYWSARSITVVLCLGISSYSLASENNQQTNNYIREKSHLTKKQQARALVLKEEIKKGFSPRALPLLAIPAAEIIWEVIAGRAAIFAVETAASDAIFATTVAEATATAVETSLATRAVLIPATSILRTSGQLTLAAAAVSLSADISPPLQKRGAYMFSEVAPVDNVAGKYQVVFNDNGYDVVLYSPVIKSEASEYNPAIVSVVPEHLAALKNIVPFDVVQHADIRDCKGYRFAMWRKNENGDNVYFCSTDSTALRDEVLPLVEAEYTSYKEYNYPEFHKNAYIRKTFEDSALIEEGYNYKIKSTGLGHPIFSTDLGPVYAWLYQINYYSEEHTCTNYSGDVWDCSDNNRHIHDTIYLYSNLNPYYYITDAPLRARFDNKITDPLTAADLAEPVNKIMEDAANQPGYQGVPYSAVTPQEMADVLARVGTEETAIDTLTDSITNGSANTVHIPVTTVTVPGDTPGDNTGSDTNVNVNVDFGPDPGIAQPELDDAPTGHQILAPLLNLFPFLKSPQIPDSAGECPTASFTLFDHDYVMDVQCTIAEQFRAVLMTVAGLCWSLLSLRIILSA